MIDLIASLLILYLLYKLIFDFIVPVSKTTSRFKSQVDELRRAQEDQLRRQQTQNTQSQNAPTVKKPRASTTTDGEYIDFEEVK